MRCHACIVFQLAHNENDLDAHLSCRRDLVTLGLGILARPDIPPFPPVFGSNLDQSALPTNRFDALEAQGAKRSLEAMTDEPSPVDGDALQRELATAKLELELPRRTSEVALNAAKQQPRRRTPPPLPKPP